MGAAPLFPVKSETQFPWLNKVQYPFRTREFDTGDGWMSYVDEGRGRPVVFVHGAPTWSYLYRHLIRGLAPYYRCIAPDHLGFGLSDKPIGVDYRPEKQAERFEALMSYLGIRDCTLVVHDAGGPIGLSWALNYPGRVREIVLFNTWMWSLHENNSAMRLARLVGNPFNRFYYRALNASPSFIMPALFADRHRIPKATQVQYLEPFRPFRERRALYAMIEGIKDSGPWFESLWRRRDAIEFKRTLILWGTKDPLYRPDYLDRWEGFLDDHDTVRFPHVGRFVPEEAARMALDEIRWFLINSPALQKRVV
jgi:haloalkane dehalogenase